MDLLIDTQSLVWLATTPQRLSTAVHTALGDEHSRFFVSAVTAWEYADLNRRLRFGADLPLSPILDRLDAPVLDYPGAAWTLAAELPDIHRDPVDRMLIAHALHACLTIVTADATMRTYSVATLW